MLSFFALSCFSKSVFFAFSFILNLHLFSTGNVHLSVEIIANPLSYFVIPNMPFVLFNVHANREI